MRDSISGLFMRILKSSELLICATWMALIDTERPICLDISIGALRPHSMQRIWCQSTPRELGRLVSARLMSPTPLAAAERMACDNITGWVEDPN
jgi:hypothetical protein